MRPFHCCKYKHFIVANLNISFLKIWIFLHLRAFFFAICICDRNRKWRLFATEKVSYAIFFPAHATDLIPHYVNYSQMHGNWKLYITHIFCISFHSPPSPLERKDRSAPLCVHTFIALPMTPVTLWHQPLIDNQHSCTCSAHTSPPQGRAEDLQIVAAAPFLWHEARQLFRLISVQKIWWFLLEMLLSVEIIQV